MSVDMTFSKLELDKYLSERVNAPNINSRFSTQQIRIAEMRRGLIRQ